MAQDGGGRTVSDVVADNVRGARRRRGWSTGALADRCAEIGAEGLSDSVIRNIEHGRPRDGRRTRFVTVDELVALALALAVPPADLMAELEGGTIPQIQALEAVVHDSNARMARKR